MSSDLSVSPTVDWPLSESRYGEQHHSIYNRTKSHTESSPKQWLNIIIDHESPNTPPNYISYYRPIHREETNTNQLIVDFLQNSVTYTSVKVMKRTTLRTNTIKAMVGRPLNW